MSYCKEKLEKKAGEEGRSKRLLVAFGQSREAPTFEQHVRGSEVGHFQTEASENEWNLLVSHFRLGH
jgi:hypothetical protein